MEFVTGVLLGAVFEVLFITVMFYKIKGLKNKNLLLLITIFISYFLSGFITSFNYINQYLTYILLNVFIFIFAKLLYKNKINVLDFFIIYYIIMTINFSCLFMMKIIGYNYLFLFSNRLILLIIMLFSGKLNKIYKFYCYNWNRHNDNKVKSVTIRNFTIISCNLMLYIINYFVLYYINIV